MSAVAIIRYAGMVVTRCLCVCLVTVVSPALECYVVKPLAAPVPSEPPAAAVSRCVCHLPVIFPLGLQCVQLQEMEHCCGSLLGR